MYEQVKRTTVTPMVSSVGILSEFGAGVFFNFVLHYSFK